MRGLRLLFVAAALVGCGEAQERAPLAEAERFVDDRSFRRQALEASIVDASNGYSRLRLTHYAVETSDPAGVAWDALPEVNLPVRPVTLADVGAFSTSPLRPSTPSEGVLEPVYSGRVESTDEALSELGRRAFELWPVQIDATLGEALDSVEALARFGLWVDGRERVGGLVRVATPDGSEHFALTCSTCHSRPDERGELVLGASNTQLLLGAIGNRDGAPALPAWGHGRVDVTPDGRSNPTAITDLRPLRHQSHLNWAGTLLNSRAALAVRTDTLMITSAYEHARPPRQVSYAIAHYLWSLGETPLRPAARTAEDDEVERGFDLFQDECARCHGSDGSVAASPIALSQIGTDAAVGESTMRGTGAYRVPSLWGVVDRPRLMHDGVVGSLEEMFDPARLEHTPGHRYGLDLTEAERQVLLVWVRLIGTEGAKRP